MIQSAYPVASSNCRRTKRAMVPGTSPSIVRAAEVPVSARSVVQARFNTCSVLRRNRSKSRSAVDTMSAPDTLRDMPPRNGEGTVPHFSHPVNAPDTSAGGDAPPIHLIKLRRLVMEVPVVELAVVAAYPHQVVVAPLLDDFPLMENDDAIGLAHGW